MTQELLDMGGIKLDLHKEAYDTSWSLSSTVCQLYSDIITLIPRIRTNELRIRFRIRIQGTVLFASVAFNKTPKE